MKLYDTTNRSTHCCYAVLSLFLSLPVKVFATELNVVLAEQEEQLLLIAEQKRQLQNLSDLLPTLQALTRYPQATIELLFENMPMGRLSITDKELLKQIINTLRPQPEAQVLPSIVAPEPEPAPAPILKAEDKAKPKTTEPRLSPILVLLTDQKDKWASRVVFQFADSPDSIIAYLGQTFAYQGSTYQLLDIHYDSSNSSIARFDIRLQTPQGIKTYRLPESL